MQAKEAARIAIKNAYFYTDKHVGWNNDWLLPSTTTAVNIERTILRAFALAGYGWRDIAEAKKDDSLYLLWNSEDPDNELSYQEEFYLGGWNNLDERWYSIYGCRPQPTHFMEIPSSPKNEGESDDA